LNGNIYEQPTFIAFPETYSIKPISQFRQYAKTIFIRLLTIFFNDLEIVSESRGVFSAEPNSKSISQFGHNP